MVELLGLRVRVEQNTEGGTLASGVARMPCAPSPRGCPGLRRPNVLTREDKVRSLGSIGPFISRTPIERSSIYSDVAV
jgi:hypothetical protein